MANVEYDEAACSSKAAIQVQWVAQPNRLVVQFTESAKLLVAQRNVFRSRTANAATSSFLRESLVLIDLVSWIASH